MLGCCWHVGCSVALYACLTDVSRAHEPDLKPSERGPHAELESTPFAVSFDGDMSPVSLQRHTAVIDAIATTCAHCLPRIVDSTCSTWNPECCTGRWGGVDRHCSAFDLACMPAHIRNAGCSHATVRWQQHVIMYNTAYTPADMPILHAYAEHRI